MTGPLERFFADNTFIVSSVAAQAYFMLGLALAVQYWRHSHVPLARHLKWVATFGLLLAFHEWGEVFIPLQQPYLDQTILNTLRLLQAILLAAAFACLFEFGVEALGPLPGAWRWLPLIPAIAFGLWMAWAIGPLMVSHSSIDHWHMEAMVWARYALALPGALLAAFTLLYHTPRLTAPMEIPYIARWLRVAAGALLALAVFSGLIVPSMPWPPANMISEEAFQNLVVIPITVFRGALGLVLALAFIKALGLFRAELDRQMQDLREAQTLSEERERLSRELHDGALQSIYGAGLLLRSIRLPADDATAESPLNQRIGQSLELLNSAVEDLRTQIGALQTPLTSLDLASGLEDLVARRHLDSLVAVEMDLDLPVDLAPEPQRVAHVLAVANEALSNVVRHSRASRVTLRAWQSADGLCLEVADNGRGISPDSRPGAGLVNMRARARLLGGSLTVECKAGKGTTILLDVPWKEAEKANEAADR